jgi:O-antigen/teichoic acid export membrane protein
VGTALLWRVLELIGVKAIFLVRVLILARLLAPEDFGLLAIAVTTIGFLLSVTDFGMIPALVQRTTIDDRHYNAAWTVGLIRAIAVAGTVALAAPLIAGVFAEPRAIDIVRVLAIRPVLEAAASIKVAGLIRNLQFRSLAFVKLSEAVLNTIVSISLASSLGVWALVAGALAGAAAYLLTSYLLAPHSPRFILESAVSRPLIRYGRWIFLTGLIAVFGGAVLKVAISRQLGITELGLYFLAARLAFMPADLASKVAGSVAFPLYARLQSDIRQATRTFWALLTGMATLLLPVCGLIIALAPSLVEDILGPRWLGTTPVIRVLAVVGMIGLLGEAIVPVLKGFGQPYKVAALEAVQSLLLIGLVWWLTARYGLIGAAIAWLPAVAVSQGISGIFAKQIIDQPFRGLKAPMMAIILASGVGAIVAFLVDTGLGGILGFVAANLIGLAIIGFLLWLSDRRFDLGLARALARAFPQAAALVGFSAAEG